LREYAADWSGFECADGERFTDLRARLRRHAFDRQRNEDEARRLFVAEPEDTLSYFPAFPIVRPQPFPRKIRLAKSKIMGAIDGDEFEAESCTKRYIRKARYTHGVLMSMCSCKRQKLLGFVVLGEAESPYALLNSIASRFPLLPKYVVNDHGCGVASCAAAVAPWILAETTFTTDRFHVVGHSCTETTKPPAFPSLRGANSVSHEQRNSLICVIKSSLRRPTQGTHLVTLQVQQTVLNLVATARSKRAR
jgi:hypothetical protein